MKGSALMSISLLVACGVAAAATAGKDTAGKDNAFAMKAAQGGVAEVNMGQLAASQASDPKVKEFAQKMVTDHSKANNDLKAAASQESINLPQDESKSQKAAADKLGKLQGDAFDKEYARMMVKDHEEDVALFKKEAQSGKDPTLKEFAQKTLPTLEEHLQMAKALPGNTKTKSTRQ